MRGINWSLVPTKNDVLRVKPIQNYTYGEGLATGTKKGRDNHLRNIENLHL